jgi:hypothetical protein
VEDDELAELGAFPEAFEPELARACARHRSARDWPVSRDVLSTRARACHATGHACLALLRHVMHLALLRTPSRRHPARSLLRTPPRRHPAGRAETHQRIHGAAATRGPMQARGTGTVYVPSHVSTRQHP